MSNNKDTIDSWIRYFRLAKRITTLETMRERCAAKSPEKRVMINIAASHRESEIVAGRLLEIGR